MRIKFKEKILEVNKVFYLEDDGDDNRFVSVYPVDSVPYLIDCEEPNYAIWLMTTLLCDGYFDASGVDYTDSCDDGFMSWISQCLEKMEEQKVFDKWINGGR